MELYHWRLDIPGNYEGVVAATDVNDATDRIKTFAESEYNEHFCGIEMSWIGYLSDNLNVFPLARF